MKKYIAPEAALVNYAAETMLALSFDVKEGTDETVGSNHFGYDEEWDD